MKLKKFDFKIIIISVIFVIISMCVNFTLINIMIYQNISATSNVYQEQISNNLKSNIDMLKKSVEKISSNDQIIKILENNKNYHELSSDDAEIVMNQINTVESILGNMSFVNNINIVSLDGKYLFSKGKIYKDFDMTERVWFKDEYLKNKTGTIVTDVHTNYTTKESTIALISFIYSKDGSKVLGAAVLDIFVYDMINFINSSFLEGDLKSYIISSNGNMYTENGLADEEYRNELSKGIKGYHIIVSNENILENENCVLFFFDKESIKYNSLNSNLYRNVYFIVILFGVITGVLLIISIKLIYKPVLKVMNKLKNLLDEISDDIDVNDINNKNNIKQLEMISDSLEKSFDKKIKELIYHDELTKLPNRKKIKLICDDMLKNDKPFALIFLDLNKFKYINDVFGHTVGDELLVRFSDIIKSSIGNSGIAVRYSGDEFIILYKDYKDKDSLISFYNENIKSRFENPILINDKLKIHIEFTAGVAIYPEHGTTYGDLIKKSDFMMYKNKQSNTNELFIFNDEIYKESIYVDTLKNELKNAIKNDEFTLYYQPIINSKKEVKKAEALIRWNNNNLGFVPPDKFINYAEETRDIIHIGYWVIDTVCKHLKYLHENNIFIQININVSPIQIIEEDFVYNAIEIIEKYGIDYKDLCFEITESVVLDNNKVVNLNILKLRELGIKIALDDFGTGYSSFSYLKKYKLDILKIDKIFIQDSYNDGYKIVSNIKEIAKTLGMDVVVEGVETEEQFNILSDIGCDFLQGYYFSRPVLLDSFKELIEKRHNVKNK